MAITLSGGVINTFTSGAVNYKSHTFTGSIGQLTVTGTGTQAVQFLLVGGGGGGARGAGGTSNTTDHGNGGGGGGVFYTASYVIGTTYPTWSVLVGDGGLGGSNAAAATVGGITTFLGPAVNAKAITSSLFADGAFFRLSGSISGTFFVTSSTTQVDAAPIYYVITGSTANLTATAIATKINSLPAFNITASASASNLLMTASIAGTAGNSFRYVSSSFTLAFTGGINETRFTGSYGGFGGQPEGGVGASGGGSFPTGAAAIFGAEGTAGGAQKGKSGAGGGGAASAGSDAYTIFDNPFTFYNGGNGGAGRAFTIEDGTTKHYGSGGGGGGWVNVGPGGGGTGGNGVGGDGGSGVQAPGKNGLANRGGGGGGGALSDQSSNWGAGGNGGSGVVVITYTV